MKYLRTFLKSALYATWPLFHRKQELGNRIPVLCYHRVLPDLDEELSFEIWSILPAQYESQMAFLAENHFTTLSLTEYAQMAQGLLPVKEKSILLTFDDGFADNYAIAWSLARKYQLKINLFLTTGYIGALQPIFMAQDGYTLTVPVPLQKSEHTLRGHIRNFPNLWMPLTWEQIREMQAAGVQHGFHSHSHRNLALLTPDALGEDIGAGLAVMERELGQRPRYFALPYGFYHDYTPAIIDTLKHFQLELIFGTHYGRAQLPSTRQVFPRISITAGDDMMIFQQKIFGMYDWFESVQTLSHRIFKRYI